MRASTRRTFMTLAGASAATTALSIPYSGRSKEEYTSLKAVGFNRLLAPRASTVRERCQGILDQFYNAPSGTLMFYYQVFWPVFITGDLLETVKTFVEICKSGETSPQYHVRYHRVRALPALASAHALGADVSRDTAMALEEIIIQILHRALRIDPHEAVIEIVWQGMTAALIRNEGNWKKLRISSRLVEQAEAVCREFLRGHDVLIDPAIRAWQFLLTYGVAVKANKGAREETRSKILEATFARMKETNEKRFIWLDELRQLYSGQARRDQMLPQIGEALMARGRLPSDAINLLTLTTLLFGYANYRIVEGHPSPYQPTERAQETIDNMFGFLKNFNLLPKHWPMLRKFAEQKGLLFPKEAILYLERSFNEYGRLSSLSDLEKSETKPELLAGLVPFRETVDEETVSYQMHQSGENILASNTSVIGLWMDTARFVAQTAASSGATPAGIGRIPEGTEEKLAEIAAGHYESQLDDIRYLARVESVSKVAVKRKSRGPTGGPGERWRGTSN